MVERVFKSEEERKAVMSKLTRHGGKKEWKEYHEPVVSEEKNEKWFRWEKSTNWRKEQSPTVRRKHVLDAADDRFTLKHKYYWAYHKMNALVNCSRDESTSRKAREDANYFLNRYHGINNGGK